MFQALKLRQKLAQPEPFSLYIITVLKYIFQCVKFMSCPYQSGSSYKYIQMIQRDFHGRYNTAMSGKFAFASSGPVLVVTADANVPSILSANLETLGYPPKSLT